MEVLADEGDPCVGLCLLVISFGMFRCSNFSETKKCLSSSSTCNSDQLSLHVEYEEEKVYYKISMQAEKLELSFSKAAETADTFWVELQLQACSVQERRAISTFPGMCCRRATYCWDGMGQEGGEWKVEYHFKFIAAIKLNSCYFAHYYIIEFTLRGAERKIVLEHN
ncbi:hypothetical protein T02_15481 [Trichinella nativa]|uniref:Uncharacterized protein n=1 Tax=Trichinella nativa TaxID=6335 RepID=A0A0V1LEN8_9BILA|nr:hypothetical protein T02_15481 [Trichinella nativa]